MKIEEVLSCYLPVEKGWTVVATTNLSKEAEDKGEMTKHASNPIQFRLAPSVRYSDPPPPHRP
jgi:hypothetical protein